LLSEKIIPPKGEGEIKVTYSSGKRRGKQSKSIQVHSNDPGNPKVPLKVQGLVKEAVICTPNRVNFGNVLQGESATKQIIVKPGEGEKAKIKNVTATSEHVTATYSKGEEKGQYIVDVSISPETPRGRINAQLKIETDNENAKTVSLTVMATITGDIVTTPERLTFVIQKGEKSTGSVLSIEKARGENLQISKVVATPDFITTNLETVTEGKLYKISVNATDDAPIGRKSGNITIFTNSPDDPEMRVPLSVTVRGNLTIIPEQLSFGVVNQGKASTKTISVSTKREKLKIKKAEIKDAPDYLKVVVDNKQQGKRSVVRVTVGKDATVGPIKGTVIIRTDDPLQPTLEVPITGRGRAQPST